MSIMGGRVAGARGGGDLLSLDLDLEEERDLGVLGDLGGVEVGVWGVLLGGESAVGVPGVPGVPGVSGVAVPDLEAAPLTD